MIKRICLLLLAMALLLGGCDGSAETPPDMPVRSASPPSADSDGSTYFTTDIYYFAEGYKLAPETRQILLPDGMTRAEAALSELATAPKDEKLGAAIYESLAFDSMRVLLSGNVCLVYLDGINIFSSKLKEQDILKARAAIAATVAAAEGVVYTDVYINGLQPGYSYRPLGAIADLGTEVNVLSMQFPPPTDKEANESGVMESRDAIVYFTDARGTLLICDIKPLQYNAYTSIHDIITLLFAAMHEGPADSDSFTGIVPADMVYKTSTFRRDNYEELLPAGGPPISIPEEENTTFTSIPSQGVLTLYLEYPHEEYDTLMVCASIVNTVTSFLPRITATRIYINERLITTTDLFGGGATGSGLLTRADFNDMIGHTATLCYPGRNGLGLSQTQRLVKQSDILNRLKTLQLLFAGPEATGAYLWPLTPEDMLSVSLRDTLAVVNTRAGFYDKLARFVAESQAGPETAASLGVFSMVNTLCAMNSIEKVQFLEEGQRIDKSLTIESGSGAVNTIYLGNPLYYNPGILLES
ncbi:MAG: GerMN domain-containing protein [Clostridiales bacterium]|jgi:hypothetical protein|nr:GerMN domain-containing protein [Clostridiales bacterium]